MGPINYRPLKELGSPGLIVEPPKHRTSIARIRVAIPAQIRAVEKLLEPKSMGFLIRLTWVRNLLKTQGKGDPVELHGWPRSLQFMISQILERRERSF